MAGLEKLKISSFSDADRNDETGTFTVMFNPSTYSINYELEYKEEQGAGSTGSPQNFEKIKPQVLAIDVLIDGTGVTGEKVDSVDDKVMEFLATTTGYDGEEHRPPYLRLSWGRMQLDCVITSAKVNYTLFKPDGTALRAKISCSFKGQVSDKKQAAEKRNSSPDLTHYRTVKDGDTLQLMSTKIYGNPDHYLEVARVNNLNNFRTLTPGDTLYFPPIDKATSAT